VKKLLLSILIILCAFSLARALPDYEQKATERYTEIFATPELQKGWQDVLDSNYPGYELKKIDFKFELKATYPNDEKTIVLGGRLELWLRIMKDNRKSTFYLDRKVILLVESDTGKILDGKTVNQEDPQLTSGWGGIEV
jgi:hypothetical protein